MKNFILLIPIGFLFLFGLASCHQVNGNGPIVQESRKLTGFNTVISDLPTDIYISHGEGFEVSLEGQQNILDLTESNIDNNRLTFKLKDGYSVSRGIHLIIRIKCPVINGLVNAGSGNIEVINHFQTTFLKIKLLGSGKIQLAGVWADRLNATLSGSGNIMIKDGQANDIHYLLSGSGNINSSNLDAENADLRISGSGIIASGKSDTLNAAISGSGTISYQGNPKIQQHISGSGTIKKL